MKKDKIITKYLLKQQKIKFMYILVIIYSIYSALVYGGVSTNTTDAILFCFTNVWSNIFLLLLLALVGIQITKVLNEMSVFKIRNKNKMEEITSINKQVVLITLLIILSFSIMQIFIIIITHGFNNVNSYIIAYNMPYIYLIIFIVRYIIIMTLYSMLIASLSYIIPNIVMIVIITLNAFLLYIYPYNFNIIVNGLSNIKLYIGYYFSILPYSSISTELFCSSFYIIILIILYMILLKLIFTRNKFKYYINIIKIILKSDISSLKCNLKKVLLWTFIIIFCFYIFKILTNSLYSESSIYKLLGLNLTKDTDIISIFLLLVYIFLFLYMGFYLFVKDILYQLCNYFLRIKLNTWYYYKVFSITFISCIFKAIFYIIVYIISILCSIKVHNLLNFYLYDCIITTFLQQFLILLYMCNQKEKILLVVLLISGLSFTGLSIIDVNNKIVVYIIFLLLTLYFIRKKCIKSKEILFERKVKI